MPIREPVGSQNLLKSAKIDLILVVTANIDRAIAVSAIADKTGRKEC
jgi:polysaccharide pyruvyl transferase WcaK-like protein